MMKTDVVCPYCKKRFEADMVVTHNPYVKEGNPPMIQEVGISKYIKLKDEDKVK